MKPELERYFHSATNVKYTFSDSYFQGMWDEAMKSVKEFSKELILTEVELRLTKQENERLRKEREGVINFLVNYIPPLKNIEYGFELGVCDFELGVLSACEALSAHIEGRCARELRSEEQLESELKHMCFEKAKAQALLGKKVRRATWEPGHYFTSNFGARDQYEDLPFRRYYPDGSNAPWMSWNEKHHKERFDWVVLEDK